MLNSSTIRKINDEIARELRYYNSIFCTSQEDKLATLERVSTLKSLLDPSPTAEQIASALVDAMSPAEEPKPEPIVTTVNVTPLVEVIMHMSRLKQR